MAIVIELFNNVNSFNSKTSSSNQRNVDSLPIRKRKQVFLERNLKMTKNNESF